MVRNFYKTMAQEHKGVGSKIMGAIQHAEMHIDAALKPCKKPKPKPRKNSVFTPSFTTAIKRIFNAETGHDYIISGGAITMINSILQAVTKTLARHAQDLNNKVTLSMRHILLAIRLVFDESLGLNVMDKTMHMVTVYEESIKAKSQDVSKVQILVPPYMARKILKGVAPRVEATACAMLAAVVQVLVSILIQRASEYTNSEHMRTIMGRHVNKVMNTDTDMVSLVAKLHLVLQPECKPVQQKPTSWRDKKIKRNILELQKDTSLQFQAAPFSRWCVAILNNHCNPTNRLAQDLMPTIQDYLEKRMIEFFDAVNLVAQHSNRVTVHPNDVELTVNLTTLPTKALGSLADELAPKIKCMYSGARRLSRKAAIKAISHDSIEATMAFFSQHLAAVLNAADMVCSAQRKRTLTGAHFKEGLGLLGIHVI